MKKELSEDVKKLRKEMEYRNYSESSVKTYCELMSSLELRLSKSLVDITVEDLKGFLHLALTKQKLSVSYANQNISAYKIFVQDVMRQEWEGIKIKRPRREKKLPVVLSINEIERMIVVTRNLKHRAMLMLMYSAGLRRMELQQMKPSAIDSERMLIHISQGKGKKDRYSILSQKTLDILRQYYKLERPKIYLFEPNSNAGNLMSDRTIDHIVRKSAERAGIKKTVSCHTLRHSFATHLLETGVNLKLIQQFLGHTSLKTTSIYLHLTNINPGSVKSPLEDMDI
jgi:site-specific recombinase XerD